MPIYIIRFYTWSRGTVATRSLGGPYSLRTGTVSSDDPDAGPADGANGVGQGRCARLRRALATPQLRVSAARGTGVPHGEL